MMALYVASHYKNTPNDLMCGPPGAPAPIPAAPAAAAAPAALLLLLLPLLLLLLLPLLLPLLLLPLAVPAHRLLPSLPPAPPHCSLMSDAPAHQLFVLLGPVDETQVRAAASCRKMPKDASLAARGSIRLLAEPLRPRPSRA